MKALSGMLKHAKVMCDSLIERLGRGPTEAELAHDPDMTVARSARRVIWTMGWALFAFVIWATFFQLDVASRGVGEVVPAGQVKRIQHLEGGIVREIFVQEGQKVVAGQPLVELEGTASQSDSSELLSRLGALRIRIARLDAQLRRQKEVRFDGELERQYPEQIAAARELFRSQRERLQNSSSGQTHKVSQRRAEIEEITSRIAQLGGRDRLLSEQVGISVKLLKEGLTNQYAHLELLKEQTNVAGQLSEAEASLRKAQASLEAERVAMSAVDVDEDEALRKDLDESRSQLGELGERMKKFADSSMRTTIRAPLDGVVMSLFVVTRGGVIPPGGTVMTIVPGDDRLVVEVKLPVTDVGFVQVGQPTRLQLTASAGRRTQPLQGKVIHVSPDVVSEPQKEPYVLVRVAPESDRFQAGSWQYRLRPGSQLSTSILTGERSVLAYIVDPFRSGIHMAMTEP